MQIAKLFFVSIIFMLGCASANHSYPELVQKRFSPARGGTIEHTQPQSNEETIQYRKASANLMKQFCKSKFKVISETILSSKNNLASLDPREKASPPASTSDDKIIQIVFDCENGQEN